VNPKSTPSSSSPATSAASASGRKQFKTWHLSMMALGLAIGAGFFIGTGSAIAQAGPAVLVSYAVAAVIVVSVMLALAELASSLPTTGSFSSYAEAGIGRWAGFTIGWLYWVMLIMVSGLEVTGAATFFVGWFPSVPQWAIALAIVVIIGGINLLAAGRYGFIEAMLSMVKVVAIVNTPGSTISRESDAVILTHAGPEIAVASTKAFTSQVTACYILGLYLAQVRGNKYADEIADYMEKLARLPEAIQKVLDSGESVRQFARTMKDATSVIYLGRHVGYPVALEGALKLKEICYIHAEGFAAGELKHGPIALVDEGQPVVVIVPTPRRPELHAKVLANIQEVRARGARTIVIAEEGDTSVDEFAEVVFRVPPVPTLYAPLLTIVPLQIFACELAAVKGLDVDQPRNLAKSVTVE